MAENGPAAAAFAAPGRYIQGRGAIHRMGEVLEQLGSSKPLILLDPMVKEIVSDALESVSGAFYVDFNGECSPEEIDRVAGEAHDGGADAVVAVGGGKVIDTAKAVANPEGLPLVIAATIASTDAPTSSLSVIYTEEGELQQDPQAGYLRRGTYSGGAHAGPPLLRHPTRVRASCQTRGRTRCRNPGGRAGSRG
jgi:glycerol dehydrogenase